jgi:hypothetical protein
MVLIGLTFFCVGYSSPKGGWGDNHGPTTLGDWFKLLSMLRLYVLGVNISMVWRWCGT